MKKLKQEIEEELYLNLTLDIITDILSRLDVKTLSRLKCVSRACRDFISDPVFVNTHRQQSMKNINYLSWSSRVSPFDNYSTVLSFFSISGQRNRCCKLLSSFTFKSYSFECVCPVTCDLVCFSNKKDIYLCNPSTHELCVLPKPSTSLYKTRLGFGYSHQVSEYKVVCLFPTYERSKTEVDTKIKGMQCEVLTVSDNTKLGSSSWKRLRCPRSVYPRTISASGKIYWLIDHRASLHTLRTVELILSFDIVNDTFGIIPRPPRWPLKTYKNSLVFMVMNGMLCITDKSSMQKNAILDIWMLRENCLWTKVYSINLLDYSYNGTKLSPWVIHNMSPECMVRGEIIFESGSRIQNLMNGRFSCNIERKTLCKICLPPSDCGMFWESLFRLK